MDDVSAAIRKEGERTRQHIDGIADSLRAWLRLIAKCNFALQEQLREQSKRTQQRFDAVERRQLAMLREMRLGRKQIDRILKNHEKRITRLEASDARRRGRKSR